MQFLDVFIRAFQALVEHRWTLLKFLSIPVILNVFVDIAMHASENEGLIAVDAIVLSPYLYVIIAVTTHRVILLGKDSVNPWGALIWQGREFKFFACLVALVSMAIVLFLPTIVPIIGILLSLFLIGWIVSRFCLLLPIIAIDLKPSFKECWEITKDYQLLMALVVIAVPTLVALPMAVVNIVIEIQWLNSIAASLTTIFEVAVLSVTYQTIQQEINFERF